MTHTTTRFDPAVLATAPNPTRGTGDVRARATEAMHDVLQETLPSELMHRDDMDLVAARCAKIALEIVAEAATPAARALRWADATDPAVQRAVTALRECL